MLREPVADNDALARYYDLDLAGDDPGDVDMYLALADATDGTALELMAGSGRIVVPLALAGHEVVAVDNDAAMLGRAAALWRSTSDRAPKGSRAHTGGRATKGGSAAKAGRAATGSLELVEADATTLRLKKRFGLVFVALNGLLLLDGRAAQAELMKVAARHLTRGGRAVFDVWLPAPDDLVLYDGRLVLDWVRDDEATGEHVAKTTSARYQTAARCAEVTSFFDAWHDGEPTRRTLRIDRISFISADELVSLAESAGLQVDQLSGDYEMGDFAAESNRVVMVCRRFTD